MRTSRSDRTVDSHIRFVCALAQPVVAKQRPLQESMGHFLASEIRAVHPVPRFANSAMDGFAVHLNDLGESLPATLPVAGDVAAGSECIEVPPGKAIRIMTGAPIQDGDDVVVVPVENTDIPRGPIALPDQIVIHSLDPKRRHIRSEGENVRAGDAVAHAGTRMHAGTLAALISTGVNLVDYVVRPRVAVISTGSELGTSADELLEAQIPDSNGPMLAWLARSNGARDVSHVHVTDDVSAVREALARAASEADIVVTSGGVSAGAYDVIREVAESAPDMWFGNVTQRPGSPQGAGMFNEKPLVCLPGNPVAAWVSFHLYVAPLIARASGSMQPVMLGDRPQALALLDGSMPRVPARGFAFTPAHVTFESGGATATTFNGRSVGSGHVASLVDCNGLAMMTEQHRGTQVPVLFTQQ